ncbi:MAG: dTDP-4-dehydrorhamnose reductase [Chlorobiaceae bacterium]|nr:dTDP-4-dehydrorhamnose reductase [Chlorobiaceae bacterium]NTW73703.1 dTDP-4-dehydrorhamnose reductase [Chlorobiaceae bacterium]
MHIMVTGSGGQLGSEFRAIADRYPCSQLFFFDHGELDIASESAVEAAMRRCCADVVVNCAAFTSVDRAETDPDAAFRANRDGAGVLARSARRHDALLVHFSTYYVFDGRSPKPYREDDPASPDSVYGKSKLQGEALVRQVNPSHLIIRTGWLYSRFGENFVKTMLRLGRERDQLDVVSDRIGSPTHAEGLASAVMRIIEQSGSLAGLAATCHYCDEGVASWFDLAVAVMAKANLPCNVRPVESSAFPVHGPRPWYSVMGKQILKSQWGIETPHWQSALGAMLDRRID